MNDLQLISLQKPGLISIENFTELRSKLANYLSRYQGLAYSEESLADAKADKKELTRLRKELDNRRKEVKRTYLAPYNEFEAQVKELLSMIDSPLDEIKTFITRKDELEKAEKRVQIETFYRNNSSVLKGMAEKVLSSPAFFESRWLNKTTSVKTWQDEIRAKISLAARDLDLIQKSGGIHTDAMIVRYLEHLDMEDAKSFRDSIQVVETSNTQIISDLSEDTRHAFKVLRLSGSVSQIIHVMELLELEDVEVEELEDGMPQSFHEHNVPDFSSFVAFDIETTGTYGAASGDKRKLVPCE